MSNGDDDRTGSLSFVSGFSSVSMARGARPFPPEISIGLVHILTAPSWLPVANMNGSSAAWFHAIQVKSPDC
ncbi:unnamed protein product [Mycena citricolor]|uniref:Uncharacterized protein n=1 Tax=Mycena citricolor TaxID=2018698 RepID=A0AAD2HIM9_9AGAR|nr:unnamed protein product [Mycena citricolor]